MIDGWGSCLSDLTTFISFHLRSTSEKVQTTDREPTHSERTRAAVVDVLDLCTSLTAMRLSRGA